jgi:hypothetical protein
MMCTFVTFDRHEESASKAHNVIYVTLFFLYLVVYSQLILTWKSLCAVTTTV